MQLSCNVESQTFKTSPRVSIIMQPCHQLEMTQACVASIKRNTPEPHEIIFVDTVSRDEATRWLTELAESHQNYRLIADNETKGFSKGCNQGIKVAQGQYILLLNNDLVVTEGWLQGMLECYQSMKNVAVVGPLSDNVTGIQQIEGVTFDSTENLEKYACHVRTSRRYRRVHSRLIDGVCMMFPREMIDRIGYLDERFSTQSYACEDYCIRAALEGFVNIVTGDVFIHRHANASFKGNTFEDPSVRATNYRLFNEKWSCTVSDPELGRKICRLKTLEKAEEAARRGNSELAVDILIKEGLRQFPHECAYYHALALLFMESDRNQDALDVLNEVPVTINDNETMLLKGFCQAAVGKFDEALRCAGAVLAKGQDARALCIKGLVAIMNDRKVEGERLLRSSIACDPCCLEAHLAMGQFYTMTQNSLAKECFKQACIVDPSSALAASYYVEQLASQEDLENAIQLIAENLKFYPVNRRVHFLYISILLRLGRDAEAMLEAERAILEYGLETGLLQAAASIREKLGPMTITPEGYASGCSVSLCMIVKNEEHLLPKCLSSLKPLVDEMIIVDTGSTDHTMEIARIMGARVVEMTWQDDYSVARNLSLEQARGNWILVMDADEVISSLDYEAFHKLIHENARKLTAFNIVTRNYSNRMDEEGWRPNDGLYRQVEMGGGWRPSDKVRLFTNDSRIRFEGHVHELVEPSLMRLGIGSVDTDNVWAHHYGYLDDVRQKDKKEKYYRLGLKKLEESGGTPKAVCELAIQAAELGYFDEAIALWKRILAIDPDSWIALFNLGSIYLRLGMFEEARVSSHRAMKCKDNFVEAALNLAFAELCAGSPETAENIISDSLHYKSNHPPTLLMFAIVKCFRGDAGDARKILSTLRDNNIDFSDLIKESANKLEIAGHYVQAARLLQMLT